LAIVFGQGACPKKQTSEVKITNLVFENPNLRMTHKNLQETIIWTKKHPAFVGCFKNVKLH
jgi:hypothetical protein